MLTHDYLLTPLTRWQETTKYGYQISGYHRSGNDKQPHIHITHGNGFSALTLANLANHLPKDYPIWLTDLPGHGASEQPKHKIPNWQEMANAVALVIESQVSGLAQNNRKIIGVGHSLGGILTLLAAYKRPELFSKIILLDPPLFTRPIIATQKVLGLTGLWRHNPMVKAVRQRTAKWHSHEAMAADLAKKTLYKNWHPKVLQDFINSATGSIDNNMALSLACDPNWEGAIFGSYPKGLWQKIAEVSVPVTIIEAHNTYNFIAPAVNKAKNINPNITSINFGNSHCFPMEQPQETAAIITSLIQAENFN